MMTNRRYRRPVEYMDAQLYGEYCRAVQEGDAAACAAVEEAMAMMVQNLLGSYLQYYEGTLYGESKEDIQSELWLRAWKALPISCLDYPSVYQLAYWLRSKVGGYISGLKRRAASRPAPVSLDSQEDDPYTPEPCDPDRLTELEKWEVRERCGESMRTLLKVRRSPAAIFSYSFCRLFYSFLPNQTLCRQIKKPHPEERSVSRRLEREYREIALFLMRQNSFDNFSDLLWSICCQNLQDEDFIQIDRALKQLSDGKQTGDRTFGEAGGNVQNIDTWNARVQQSLLKADAQQEGSAAK